MAIRSWLFVPGDNDKKLARVVDSGADAVIVDLEDSVVPTNKAMARDKARGWLEANRGDTRFSAWVRINELAGDDWRADIAAILPAAPAGIMLPKAAGPAAVQQLAGELYELEVQCGLTPGSTRILPLVSETAASAATIHSYVGISQPRLAGLTWGAEDLSAALGASRKRDSEGRWTDTFRMVRVQVLLAAHACEVAAVDTLHADFSDLAGLERVASEARADGFTGMLAIHPSQVPVINQAFTPTEQELAEARRIVEAFAEHPDAGALQIERRMIDRPHLRLARRLLGIDD
jgi:citrate lyase subunit beta/citryl-CoA lyase